MGELIVLPQLVQNLALLHGRRHGLLLQHGHFPLHVEQVVVLLPGLLVRLVALSLQLQLLLVNSGELSAPGLPLAQKSLHLGVLLHHLLGNLLVLGLKLLHHGLTARSIPGQVLLQLLQLG